MDSYWKEALQDAQPEREGEEEFGWRQMQRDVGLSVPPGEPRETCAWPRLQVEETGESVQIVGMQQAQYQLEESEQVLSVGQGWVRILWPFLAKMRGWVKHLPTDAIERKPVSATAVVARMTE